MTSRFLIAIGIAILASLPAFAPAQSADKSDHATAEKAAEKTAADKLAADKAARELKTMEMFLGFTQQMMKMGIEQQQRDRQLKAEQEERARQTAIKTEAEAKSAKFRPFQGVADVYLDDKASVTSVTGVRLVGYVEIGSRLFAEFAGVDGGDSWVIDTSRITAVRVRKSATSASSASSASSQR
jgi:hypothetical protein